MSIEQFKKDLAATEQAINQAAANTNVLIGQKQALEHCIKKLEEAASIVAEAIVDVVAEVVEEVS